MKEDKEDLTDLEEVPIEEGREITMAGSKETATFVEDDSIEIPTIFPPKLPDLGSFLSLALWEKWGLREVFVI